jgi:hypothetical protein
MVLAVPEPMQKTNAPRRTPNATVQPATLKASQTGAPGAESSKASANGKDARSTHDKDGNSAQVASTKSKARR